MGRFKECRWNSKST